MTQNMHNEWLFAITIKDVLDIDPSVTWEFQVESNGKKCLILKSISERTLPLLKFYTNNDDSDESLVLNKLGVSLDNTFCQQLEIPGLTELAKEIYDHSNNIAKVDNKKIHKPFDIPLLSPITGRPIDMGTYIDINTSMVTFLLSTVGRIKIYTLVFTIDIKQNPSYIFTPQQCLIKKQTEQTNQTQDIEPASEIEISFSTSKSNNFFF